MNTNLKDSLPIRHLTSLLDSKRVSIHEVVSVIVNIIFQTRKISYPAFITQAILMLTLLSYNISCTTEEDQLLPIDEANTKIAAAYLYKDAECGQAHQISIPIFVKARTEDLEACMLQIIATDCAIWNSSQNMPAACLAISINL